MSLRDNKNLKSFISFADKGRHATGNRWGDLYTYNKDNVYDYFYNLPKSSQIKIVSDPYWNHYPFQSRNEQKEKGSLMDFLMRTLSYRDIDRFNIVASHTKGMLACICLDLMWGKKRIGLAKRSVKSKDIRLRKRCAKILPTRLLRLMTDDTNVYVKSTIISRLGADNCGHLFLPKPIAEGEDFDPYDRYDWVSMEVLRRADLSSFDWKGELELCRKVLSSDAKAKRYGTWRARNIASSIVKKISKEEALYLLDMANDSSELQNIFSEKLK
tara:strand:+ start:594 stop:1406 length:813 start_codon:yes stop_codon:yes gene_type:complete